MLIVINILLLICIILLCYVHYKYNRDLFITYYKNLQYYFIKMKEICKDLYKKIKG